MSSEVKSTVIAQWLTPQSPVRIAGCEGFASVPEVLRAARRVLGAQLYAIEMIDDAAFQANLRVHAGSMRNPLPPDAPPPTADTFYMLVEAGANRETHLSQLVRLSASCLLILSLVL